MTNNSSIVVRNLGSLEPQSIDEARAVAKDAVESRLYGVSSASAALMILMTGRDLGMSASQSFRMIQIINGKPNVAADALVAAVRRSGLCASWRVVESTPTSCTIETKRVGEDEPERETFTMEDAQRAGLTRSEMYRKWPREMLRHRCATGLARRVYPDAVLGCYEPGEMQDVAAEPVRLTAEQIVAQYDADILDGVDPDDAYRRAKDLGRANKIATKVQAILNARESANAEGKRERLEAAAGVATVAVEAVESATVVGEVVDHQMAFQVLLDELAQIDLPAGVVAVWKDNRAALKDAPSDIRQRAWAETCRAWEAYGGQGGVGGLSKAVLGEIGG